jgi:glycerophosphoryl diester phosphodiesterase
LISAYFAVKAPRLLHLVGHRGNSAEFPENTLPALRSAIALGVRFIAIDVHLSSDGAPVLYSEGSITPPAAMPSLTSALQLLEGRPEITVFVAIGRASVTRFGHEQVISQVSRALKPFRSRCVLISTDLVTIHTARIRADYPVGWILSSYDTHTTLKFEAFKPEYLFCDRTLLPSREPLWRGPWRWAVLDVTDLDTALELANRGADFVVTRNVRSLADAMRAHAAKRATRTASTVAANQVARVAATVAALAG